MGAALGGAAKVAFTIVTCAGFAMSYAGVAWLARQAGLSAWLAQLPALTFATAAYYLTNVYGRGAAESAWGEILAGYPRDSYVLATKAYFPMSSTDRGLV